MHTVEENKINNAKKSQTKPTEKEDEIKKLLRHHRIDNTCLDLCGWNLTFLPSELFVLAHIEHLYLEGNCLVELPDNFFDRLPALVWLDLRNNQLESLSISVGRHQCLKTLLLEGNRLTKLPLQLGLTKTLCGLSLQGNPLQYPPQHITDQGVFVILSFLYQELQNRSRQTDNLVTQNVEKLHLEEKSSNSEEEEILTENINLTDRKITSPMSDDYQLLRNGIAPVPASLHKPISYQDYKGKFNAGGFSDSVRGGRLKNNKDLSMLHLRHQSDARRDQLRVMKERQSAFADQRRKSYTSQQSRWRNGTTQKLPSTPVIDIDSALQSGDSGLIEIHNNIHEEVVERVHPGLQAGKRKIENSLRLRCRKSLCETMKRNMIQRNAGGPIEEAKHLLAEIEKEIRLLDENSGDNWRKNIVSKYIPFKSVKKNTMIQSKIKQHSLEIQNKLKRLRILEDCQAEDPVPSKELQRELLEGKMKRQMEVEYRFRAFTGSSRSTKSGSHKTSST